MVGVAVALVVVPLLAVVAWYGLWELPARREAARLTAELDARSLEVSTRGWSRPVLRGNPVAGNAAAEAERLARAIEVPRGLRLDDALANDAPPSRRLRALLVAAGPRLQALAESTRHPVAQLGDPLLDPSQSATPDSAAHLRAVRLLLLYGRQKPAGPCLRFAADAIRLAQDQVSGGGILRVAISSAEIGSAVTVALVCARSASSDELARAARELEILALHPAPMGDALEAEALFAAGLLRAEIIVRPKWPRFTGSAVERARANPFKWLSAWKQVLADATVLGSLDGEHYPAALDELARLGAAERDSDNPLTPALIAELRPHVERDAEAQAKLRALTIVLHALAEARPPRLADPFTGEPLRFDASRGVVRAYSVGPNRRDDRGAITSDDVVVQATTR